MAKLSKEELLTKVEATGMSEDEKISFMEDITDSFTEPDTSEIDNLKEEMTKKDAEIEDLKAKYKARFLSKEDIKEEIKEEPKEMEVKEVIDVKDIFEKEDED